MAVGVAAGMAVGVVNGVEMGTVVGLGMRREQAGLPVTVRP